MLRNRLAVVSGGMDSIVMLHDYATYIMHAVTFNYGSKHAEKQIPCAIRNCADLAIQHTVIELEFIGRYFKSALLKAGGEIPDGHYEDPSMRQTVVPFRNGIMLAIAAGLAESIGAASIMLANHAGDHAIYPDCRSEFIDAIGTAIYRGTYKRLEVLAPYTHKTKKDIANIGICLGVDFNQTWSCYKGGEKHCGTCGTCVERKEALGEFDTTEYLS